MTSKKTGWYNKNKLGNSPKYESHRHALASKGIKTSRPKAPKGVRTITHIVGQPTPNFDMVAKEIKVNVGVLTRALEKQGYSNTEITRKGNYYYVLHILKNGIPMLLYKTDDKKDLMGYIGIHYPKYSKNKKTDMVSGGMKKYYISGYAVSSPHYVLAKNKTEATKKVLKSGIIKKKNLLLYPEKEFKEKWGKYIKFESEF